MGKVGAFMRVERKDHKIRPADISILDYEEFARPLTLDEQREQASRCMNCGVAFCQTGFALGDSRTAVGCPLHNLIPETNDLLYHGRLDDAAARLHLTDPFPEFTSRVCPALCETACNLGLNKDAVTINDNERLLSDHAWERGMTPLPHVSANAPVACVIGSGPAGLAVAWELTRRGFEVHVFEKDDRPGGLLMYGIPNMKLSKSVIERRIDLMRRSGIEFHCGVDAADNAARIEAGSDVVIIATGSGVPRDMAIEGRELDGIYFALDYLSEVTRALLDGREPEITAADKDVVVIGGGDTGTDCVASALRQGARSITQVIRAQCPPETCNAHAIWPAERKVQTMGYGQREASAYFGVDPRMWSTDTIGFDGNGSVEYVRVKSIPHEERGSSIEDAETMLPAQLVLIAKGFLGADASLFEAFGVDAPPREMQGHLLREASEDKPAVFVAGDARTGSSLVVSAMADALDCAKEVANKADPRT